MDNQQSLANLALNELKDRLGQAESDRAIFKAQAIQLLSENQKLKKQIEDVQKASDESKGKQSETNVEEPKQDPQAK